MNISQSLEARIQVGLTALKDGTFSIFKKIYEPELRDSPIFFNDLMDVPEFFRRALTQGLYVPYDLIMQGEGLGALVTSNKELFLLGLPLYYASEEMKQDPEIQAHHEKRIDQGLVALREDKNSGRTATHFKISNEEWGVHVNAGNFDDLMRDEDFLIRALTEELPVPFQEFARRRHEFPVAIKDNENLVRLGLPLKFATGRLRVNKALVIECIEHRPWEFRSITQAFRGDADVACAAILAAHSKKSEIEPDGQTEFWLMRDVMESLGEPASTDPKVLMLAASFGAGPLASSGIPQSYWEQVYETMHGKRPEPRSPVKAAAATPS